MLTLALAIIAIADIDAMASPRFPVREAAHNRLASCNAALPLLMHAERHHGSLEVRRRAGMLTANWWDRMAAKHGPFPWIGPEVVSYGYWVDCGTELVPCGQPGWTNWRMATRLWIVHQLRHGRPVADVLNRLWEEEARWHWRQGTYPLFGWRQ